jgi:hypothetical protein
MKSQRRDISRTRNGSIIFNDQDFFLFDITEFGSII